MKGPFAAQMRISVLDESNLTPIALDLPRPVAEIKP